MPALSFPPALSALTAFTRFAPPPPWQTLLRSTAYKLRPPRPVPHAPLITRARAAVLASGRAETRQLATLLCENRGGSRPTIVLGGFVPDSTEQLFLLRDHLLRHGTVYYFNYARLGFSIDLMCAQLDDLVEELAHRRGQPPVIFGVSFGAGLVLEWLRRARDTGLRPPLAGVILVSPVACAADVVEPGATKPGTLLGRALSPYLQGAARVADAAVEKSRAVFLRMFEAGAQNRASLRLVLTPGELRHLRDSVLDAIHSIDHTGACERVGALRDMAAPSAWNAPGGSPLLSRAPTLVLFAEKESAVLTATSPTRATLEHTLHALFPRGECRVISGGASPVQHASLIFHYFQFLPPVTAFYRRLRDGKIRLAA